MAGGQLRVAGIECRTYQLLGEVANALQRGLERIRRHRVAVDDFDQLAMAIAPQFALQIGEHGERIVSPRLRGHFPVFQVDGARRRRVAREGRQRQEYLVLDEGDEVHGATLVDAHALELGLEIGFLRVAGGDAGGDGKVQRPFDRAQAALAGEHQRSLHAPADDTDSLFAAEIERDLHFPPRLAHGLAHSRQFAHGDRPGELCPGSREAGGHDSLGQDLRHSPRMLSCCYQRVKM